MSTLKITVPASTANMGAGFDSIGVALKRYLTLHIEQSNEWEFEHNSVHLPQVFDYKDHLIYQTASETADRFHKTLPPCKIRVESDIPLARGLGSSASAIMAGIELANQVCELSLTTKDKLNIATEMEGHPDNVAPSLFGGMIIAAALKNGEVEYVQLIDEEIEFVIFVPDVELMTKEARRILPDSYSRKESAAASAVANVMIAALLTKDFALAGKMMEEDLFHEPYRAELMPNYDLIRREANSAGAYGTVISGAGPTLISLAPKGKGEEIAAYIQQLLPSYDVEVIQMDETGVDVQYFIED